MFEVPSFRTRLGIVIFSVGLVPLMLSLLLYIIIQYQALYQDSRDMQAQTAKYVASEIEAYLKDAERVIKDLDRYQVFATQSERQHQKFLSAAVFGQTLFHSISFFDAHGAQPETTSRQSLYPPHHQQKLVKKVLDLDEALSGVRYSQVYFDPQTSEPLISMVIPLMIPQSGKISGYLVADLMLRPVWDLIALNNIEDGASIFIIDNENLVVAHKNPSVVLRKSHFEYLPEYAIHSGLSFAAAVVAAQPIMLGTHLYQVIMERERKTVLKPLLKMFWISLVVLALALPFMVLAMVQLRRYILIPVKDVTEASRHIKDGDYSARVSYQELDEIGEMAQAFNDMSARLETTTSTLDDEQKLRTSLLDTLPDLITIKDLDLNLIDCNKAFVDRVGRPKKTLIGKRLDDIYTKDIEGLMRTYDRRVLASKKPTRYEFRTEWPNGDVQHLDSIKVPMRSSTGEITGLISISRDITAYKETLSSLRTSEREFRLAIEKSPLPIALTKANGDIEHFNPKFQETFGWTSDEINTAAQWWLAAYPEPEYRRRVMASWENAISEARAKNEEIAVQQWSLTCKNGDVREVEFRMVLLTPSRHLVVMNDITERIHTERELKDHRDHLEELVALRTTEVQDKAAQLEAALEREKEYNTLQQKFVALVSHEFRTPLTIIDGTAQRFIRRKDKLDADEVEARANKVRSAVTRMVGLIDTTLFASRLDAGKIQMQCVLGDIGELLLDVCERQAEIAPNHQFDIEIEGLPNEMLIDLRLLDQVFTNLLSNAVKYSPQAPHIDVKGWQEGENVVITVSDGGVGIPQDELPHMFGRFFRASSAEGIKGTGLGLSVCKEFVEMHGGTIAVDSVPGEGTTFTVRIPIKH